MCTAIPYMETVFSLVGLHIWDSGTLYHKITKKHAWFGGIFPNTSQTAKKMSSM